MIHQRYRNIGTGREQTLNGCFNIIALNEPGDLFHNKLSIVSNFYPKFWIKSQEPFVCSNNLGVIFIQFMRAPHGESSFSKDPKFGSWKSSIASSTFNESSGTVEKVTYCITLLLFGSSYPVTLTFKRHIQYVVLLNEEWLP